MKNFSYDNGYFAVTVNKGEDVAKTFDFECSCFDCKVKGIARLESVTVTESGNTVALYKKRGTDKTSFALNNRFVCGNCSRTYIMGAFRTNVTKWYLEDIEDVNRQLDKAMALKNKKSRESAIAKISELNETIERDYLSAFQDAMDELKENREKWLEKQAAKEKSKDKEEQTKK